ncbi:hypothetical protein BDZ91DRAFT_765024 [Kalaharituber pfeilii]|nr:hypothetical protein BDZ91DRAFT_765024 [Kalaharituber pfeilii]
MTTVLVTASLALIQSLNSAALRSYCSLPDSEGSFWERERNQSPQNHSQSIRVIMGENKNSGKEGEQEKECAQSSGRPLKVVDTLGTSMIQGMLSHGASKVQPNWQNCLPEHVSYG